MPDALAGSLPPGRANRVVACAQMKDLQKRSYNGVHRAAVSGRFPAICPVARPSLRDAQSLRVCAFAQTEQAKGVEMSGKTDKAKGRVKEALGALTGDRKLKREGKIDQAAGDVKDAADRTVERVKDALNR